jgi:hypothetical protein
MRSVGWTLITDGSAGAELTAANSSDIILAFTFLLSEIDLFVFFILALVAPVMRYIRYAFH